MPGTGGPARMHGAQSMSPSNWDGQGLDLFLDKLKGLALEWDATPTQVLIHITQDGRPDDSQAPSKGGKEDWFDDPSSDLAEICTALEPALRGQGLEIPSVPGWTSHQRVTRWAAEKNWDRGFRRGNYMEFKSNPARMIAVALEAHLRRGRRQAPSGPRDRRSRRPRKPPQLRLDDLRLKIHLGKQVWIIQDPKAYQLFKAIHMAAPAKITATTLRLKVSGVKGSKAVRTHLANLPDDPRSWIHRDRGGYWLRLP
jgi:hypothetical protein